MVIVPAIFKRKHPRIRNERIHKEAMKRWENWQLQKQLFREIQKAAS